MFALPQLHLALSRSRVSLLPLVSCAIFCSCVTLTQPSSPRLESTLSNESSQKDSRININNAEASELAKLPGIGAVLAERIVAHRKQFGAFRRVEHLMMVQGISEKKFRELRPLVKVQ